MKTSKQLLKTSIAIFCMVLFASISFANPQNPPVNGVGVVVKKNPGGGASKAITDNEGHFTMQLEEGEYTLELQPEQLRRAMAELIKSNYPGSKYKFDGSGIQLDLDKGSKLKMMQGDRTDSNRAVPQPVKEYRILVPKGGAVLSATLSWNDAVMGNAAKDGVNCPDGYTKLNGNCVPTIIVNAPWLNTKTGQIKYFEYTQDFVIDEPTLCKALGVTQITIAKGKYEVDYSNPEMGGKIRLPNVIPIKLPTSRPPILGKIYEGTNPKGNDCAGFGNSCFFATEPISKANLQTFTITPIIENGVCKIIEVQYRGNGSPKQAGF